MKNIQLIEWETNTWIKDFLTKKWVNVNIILAEDADFNKWPIITQSPDSKDLQKLIYQAKEQSWLLIDNTSIDYWINRIWVPMSEEDDMNTFSKYNVIITDIPESYKMKIQKEIQEVMDNNSWFAINYNLSCHNNFILNKIIYDLIMLDIQSKKYNFISANASYILD